MSLYSIAAGIISGIVSSGFFGVLLKNQNDKKLLLMTQQNDAKMALMQSVVDNSKIEYSHKLEINGFATLKHSLKPQIHIDSI